MTLRINGLDASFNQVVNHLGHKTLLLGAKLLYCLFYKSIDKLEKCNGKRTTTKKTIQK